MRLTRTFAATVGASTFLLLGLVGTCPPAAAASPCVGAATNAQDLRAAGKLRDARAALLVCARPTCNNVVRSDCEKWLKEVDEQLPSIVVRAADARGRDVAGVRATIDDTPVELDGSPVVVDPGQHVVRVKARSGDVAEQRTLVAAGEKARVLEVRFDGALADDGSRGAVAPPKPSENDTREEKAPPSAAGGSSGILLPLALAGVGVAALVVFTYFEVQGQSSYSDLEDGCYRRKDCRPDEVDPVRNQFVIAGVALGVAVVALAAGALIYFTSSHAPPPAKTSRSRFQLQPGGVTF